MPSTVYKNGIIYTVDKDSDPDWSQHPKEAIAVSAAGVIQCVGTDDEVDKHMCADTVVVNLRGQTVLPGIHDVHMHPLEASCPAAGTCQLRSNTSPEKLIRVIRRQAPNQVGTEWVLGFGHSIGAVLDHLMSGGRPPRLILDEAVKGRPAVMTEETSHSAWVNSEALKRAGITRDTPEIPAGIIMRDPKTGEPNGILLENAGDVVLELALDHKQYPELEDQNYRGLLKSLEKMSKNGITSACDARTYWDRLNHNKIWERAEKDGKLTARFILGLWAYPHMSDDDLINRLKKLYHNDTERLLRASQVKVYCDGLLEATTAAVLEPYLLDLGLVCLPGNQGMNYFSEERLSKLIGALQNVDENGGFDFHIHTIGDRAVHEALNAIERTRDEQQTARRHRLTHVELVAEADRPRFAELGVVADAQVAGDFALPREAQEDIGKLVGKQKAQDFIPVRSLFDAGAKVTLSSDWDVSELNPFLGIEHAVARGRQSVDLQTAIEMYTINGAYVMRQEERTGSLAPGKLADFIVIDRDIFKTPSRNIHKTKVSLTVLGGKQVYRSRYF